MHRKIISLIAAVTVLTGYSLPAFAEEISDVTTPDIVQEDVQDTTAEDSAETDAVPETADADEAYETEEEPDDTIVTEDAADEQEAESTDDDEDIPYTQPSADTSAETSEETSEDVQEESDISEDTAEAAPEEITEETDEESSSDEAEEKAQDNEETAEEELELNAADWYSWDAANGVLTLRGQLPDTYYDGEAEKDYDLATLAGIDRSAVNRIVITSGTKAGSSARAMFYGLKNLAQIDGLRNLDTSKVTDMSFMFARSFIYTSGMTSLDFSGFDTSNVKSMRGMFSHCGYLTSLDLSGFDTSNVTDMSAMFVDCWNLETLDLSGFDTSKVTDMKEMFASSFGYSSGMRSLDLSGFDTSNVTDMSDMFVGCKYLTSLDLSNFDTSKVKSFDCMFQRCWNLRSVDLSGFDTSNVEDMSYMFCYCQSLTSLDLSKFDTSKVKYMSCMFVGCESLGILDLSSFDTGNAESMGGMFGNCESLMAVFVSDRWTTKNVTSSEDMFEDCYMLSGGNNTVYNSAKTDKEYARIDRPGAPGYFSEKITAPAKPSFTVTAGSKKAVLQWNNVSGATSYRVYRYENNTFRFLTETTGTGYTDTGLTNGKKYGYLVRAFRGTAGSAYTTADIKYVTPVAVAPAKPTFSLTAGDAKVSVKWNTVSGADCYRVYRYENGAFKFLKETTGTDYTDTGLTNGKKYGYLVRAFSDGTGSAYTTADIKYATPVSAAPAKPSFTATSATAKVTVKWNTVSGATSYRVYRYENGAYKFLKETTATSYTDTGLTNGKNYGYLVRAFKGNTGSAYTNADLKYAMPVAKPHFWANAGDRMATVRWNSAKGAASYRVYRYENGAFKLLKETTGTGYTDTGLTNGRKYGYLVRAFNSTGGSSYTTDDVYYVTLG